jgi:ActR/RegA family two-component response regulator/GGDEF domain-containing protein
VSTDLDIRHDLSVVAIISRSAEIELMSRTLAPTSDRLSVATDLAEGLVKVSSQAPDVAFVELTLGDGAGLAVLHHVRALAPNVTVFALTTADHLELGIQAASLGSAGTLVMPLSGDEILNALSTVRARLAEKLERQRLQRAALLTQKQSSVVELVAEIAEADTRRDAAERLAEVLVDSVGVSLSAVYLPAAEGSRQLMRSALRGAPVDPPTFCDEMELLNFARERDLEVVRLALRRQQSGLLLLGKTNDGREAADAFPLLGLVVAQATTALALIGAREQSNRGSMKDPSSSAYTFSYFVDVAGREIDMARRHGRRFSLATIGIQQRGQASTAVEPTVQVADNVLSAVRDTDVLARVDANEFYLLLPETGGLGAHSCRRRVLAEIARATSTLSVAVGVATFPHDGNDLSRLLRVAKHRAEASQGSSVGRLGLASLTLPAMVDELLNQVALPSEMSEHGLEHPRYIELPAMDVVSLALGAVAEAAQGGQARVVAAVHPGINVGGAVRAEYGHDADGVRFDVVEVGALPGCANLEFLCIIAEHAAYGLVGRAEGNIVRAVHAADSLLVDLALQKLSDAAHVRVID